MATIHRDKDSVFVAVGQQAPVVIKFGERYREALAPGSFVVHMDLDPMPEDPDGVILAYARSCLELVEWVDENLNGAYSVEPYPDFQWAFVFENEGDAVAFANYADDNVMPLT